MSTNGDLSKITTPLYLLVESKKYSPVRKHSFKTVSFIIPTEEETESTYTEEPEEPEEEENENFYYDIGDDDSLLYSLSGESGELEEEDDDIFKNILEI